MRIVGPIMVRALPYCSVDIPTQTQRTSATVTEQAGRARSIIACSPNTSSRRANAWRDMNFSRFVDAP